jgi:hypothetical protein
LFVAIKTRQFGCEHSQAACQRFFHAALIDACPRGIEQGKTSAAYPPQVDLNLSDAPRALEPNWTNILPSNDARQTLGSAGES